MKKILTKNIVFSKNALFYTLIHTLLITLKGVAYSRNFYFSLKSNFVFIYPNNQLKTVEVYEITSPKDRS